MISWFVTIDSQQADVSVCIRETGPEATISWNAPWNRLFSYLSTGLFKK